MPKKEFKKLPERKFNKLPETPHDKYMKDKNKFLDKGKYDKN